MLGETLFWYGDNVEAVRHWDLARATAARTGERYALIITNMQQAFYEAVCGDLARARGFAEHAREVATRLGASRYLVEVDAVLSEILVLMGQRDEALTLARRAAAIGRDNNSMSFTGPLALGMLQWLSPDPGERATAHAEYEQLHARGTMVLNQIMYHRWTAEGAIERREWDLATCHLDVLATVLRGDEDSVYGYSIGRGRLLVAWGRGEPAPALTTRLRTVLDRARRLSVVVRLPADLLALAD
jgi:hypothetical protein